MATWVSTVISIFGGGFLGAALTFGLTWGREHCRSLDAYRAPQRQAIGDILAATHEYMLRELEQRTLMGDLVERASQGGQVLNREVSDPAMKALAKALLGVDGPWRSEG
jgi:hypothetical protein